jgi:ring-1,2-phenylacetyl-CoA epoxidase subunit PaaE
MPELPPPRRGFAWLRVERVEPLCDDAAAITFEVPPESAERYAHLPGQSVTVRRVFGDRDERRSYSVSAPAGGPLRIGVREVAGGAMSSWLVREVRPGEPVEVSRPTGRFTPDLSSPGRHVLVAAGSGITPLLSIAGSVLAADDTSSVVLIYGNRRAGSIMFVDEIADLKDAHPARVEIIHLLSREGQDVELFSGRLDAARLVRLLPLVGPVEAVDHWWLCGPHRMITAVAGALTDRGVTEQAIHHELFWVEDSPPAPVVHDDGPPVAGATVTVVLDGRRTTVTVPPGQTVLGAAQRLRPDLPFACKGGVCGTCRARVRSGVVRLRRNFALDDAELAAGFTLTCQAEPATDEVTVDFDG